MHIGIYKKRKNWYNIDSHRQGDSGGKDSVLAGDSIGHCEEKKLCGHVFIFLNVYRVTAV
jgi:hypothetical protein